MKNGSKNVGFLALILVAILVPIFGTISFMGRPASKSGFESITTMPLRASTEILAHEAGAVFSLADAPNHKWLLTDSEGIQYLNAGGATPRNNLFSDCKTLGDMWPDLIEPFRSLKVSAAVKGLGTGNEYLLLTPDPKIGVVYAFRT